MRAATSSAVTGRRNARRARFSVICFAQAGSPVFSGSQTKIRARLGGLGTPVRLDGPTISMPSARRGMRWDNGAPRERATARAPPAAFPAGLNMGRREECGEVVAPAGWDVQGYLREAIHDLGASVSSFSARKSLMGRPADGLAEDDPAVDH